MTDKEFDTWRKDRSAVNKTIYGSAHVINMGLNTSEYDGDRWNELVSKVRAKVEEFGECAASWSCEGKTLHVILANQLRKALPEYVFEVSYEGRKCIARKEIE